MSCDQCTDPDGESCFPMYGHGPHTHEAGLILGSTQIVLTEQVAPGFTPDPAEDGMGWWWCPSCGDGKPDEVQP
jgi:hypothetical protein